MEELFAMEDLKCVETVYLADMRSYEDPVLVNDSRILSNILNRQDDNCCFNVASDNYFDTVQKEIKPHMRKIVSDWMLEVCEEQQCQAEVFHLAINYMDRFLSRVSIKKTQFQLLGCVCMFLASKFKETCPLPSENLVIYTDSSVTTNEITQWEMIVLNVLGWDLSAVTPYSILEHLLRSMKLEPTFNLETVKKHAETFCALAATEHIFSLKRPAVVAVACLGAALRGLNSNGLDNMLSSLQISTGVQLGAIKDCMDQIEISISLSMSGASFQPSAPQPQAIQTVPKMIQNSGSFYNNNNGSLASTTPTDTMECAALNVY